MPSFTNNFSTSIIDDDSKPEFIEPDISPQEYIKTRELITSINVKFDGTLCTFSVEAVAKQLLGDAHYKFLANEYLPYRVHMVICGLYTISDTSSNWISTEICALLRNPYAFFCKKIIEILEDE